MWQTAHPFGPHFRKLLTNDADSLFLQRWRSKRYIRGLYGDMVGTKKFERWFLPDKLPSINQPTNESVTPRHPELARVVEGRTRAGGRTEDIKRRAKREWDNTAPVGSLIVQEIERRLDVCIFRVCFAQSVYQARQYVARGHVKLNGQVVSSSLEWGGGEADRAQISNPNILLEPGDIFTVKPSVIQMLKKPMGLGMETRKPAQERTEQALKSSTETPAASASDSATSPSSSDSSPSSPLSDTVSSSLSSPRDQLVAPPRDKVATSWFSLPDFAQMHIFVPAYLLPSFLTCSAVYVRHPTARPHYSEIPSPYDASGMIMSLGWEWFHRKAPRMRGRRLKWISPQRRQLKEQIPRR